MRRALVGLLLLGACRPITERHEASPPDAVSFDTADATSESAPPTGQRNRDGGDPDEGRNGDPPDVSTDDLITCGDGVSIVFACRAGVVYCRGNSSACGITVDGSVAICADLQTCRRD